jgi:hypothetical protein
MHSFLLRFLLKNILLSSWCCLIYDLWLQSYSFHFSFLVLHTSYFTYNVSCNCSFLLFSVWGPKSVLYLNGCFNLKMLEASSYYFVVYILYACKLAFVKSTNNSCCKSKYGLEIQHRS